MASMKLGSKADTFSRQDQAWFCTTGLPSDVTVEVENIFFHLHKFPLISRSGLLERMIKEALDEDEDEDEEGCVIRLDDIPGGAKSFETVAKFCYGMKLELTATTVICLRCAAEQLLMTEEYGEGNLITQTENFLEQVVFRSWKESIKALQTCDDFLPHAENLQIVQRCIESLSVKASTDPNLFSWPMEHGPMQSPGGSILWNGISTGARLRNYASGWWYDDVSCLGLPVYKRLISCLEFQGTRQEIIAGSLACYAKKYLPGLNKRKFISETSINAVSTSSTVILSEDKQKHLLEEILNLLPMKKGLASTKLLFSLLRTAMILRANHSCMSNLEKRIGMQLDQATLEDLLLPSFSYSMETLYNIDSVKIILEHFLAMEKDAGNLIEDEQVVDSPSIMPIITVARLIDGFLAEVASDVYLKLPKFQALASAIPSYARHLDDGIYRAIDIYMKAHPWLTDSEREQLCRLMDCQKLSLEACTHAAQNERLPLRVVVQVLFFEQLQLRSAIASSYLISDNLEVGSRPLKNDLLGSEDGDRSIIAARESRVLKVGMDNMRTRVIELEKECSNMKKEIEKLGKEKNRKKKDPEKFQKDKNTIREIEKLSKGKSRWGSISGKFGFNIKPQMCSAQKESVSDTKSVLSGKIEKLQTKLSKEDI